jgi:hypothetical protein
MTLSSAREPIDAHSKSACKLFSEPYSSTFPNILEALSVASALVCTPNEQADPIEDGVEWNCTGQRSPCCVLVPGIVR